VSIEDMADMADIDVVRKEESLLVSLNELRAIEHQRLADEHAAVEAAWQAKRQDRAAAERAAREAEAARIAAARDAVVAAEQARAEAEHRDRLQLEAVEAAERARHQVMLDDRRAHEELALRREVALRQRPRWMMALTGCAVAAAIGLGWFAVERQRESVAATQARAHALEAKAHAEQAMRDAQTALDKLELELQDLDGKVRAAVQRVIIAQSSVDRQAALDKLHQLQQQEAEIKEGQRRRDEQRKKKLRDGGVQIPQDCLNNAICRE
jgi:hypothetical protein